MQDKVYPTPALDYDPPSASWDGHRGFAYSLVLEMRPALIVELGVLYGGSLVAFLQGVKDLGLSTQVIGIDTWEGRAGDYHVLATGLERHYPEVPYLLMQGTFQEVASWVGDRIDILHIDGTHTHEAAAQDYHTWYPKVRHGGVLLFHDINPELNPASGVYKLWNEIKAQNPANTIEFSEWAGLGVLYKE